MTSRFYPQIRRKDSIGLIFSSKPDNETVCRVIFEILGIETCDLIGFQLMPRNRFIMKFSSRVIYEKFISEYDEKELQIGNGITVKIVNMGASYSFVSIRYAPFDMDNQMIESVLEGYGKVIWIRNNQHTLGKGNGLLNGIRTAKMEIKNNIPSSIRIAGHSVSFMYSGQSRTCYKCGSEDHLVENCVTEKTLREELTDKETHFPEIGKWNRKAKENPGFSVKDQTQDCTGDNEKHLKLNQDNEIQNAEDNTDANSKYLIDKDNVSGATDNDDELERVSIAMPANSTHISESDNEDMHINESDNEDVTVSEYGIQNNIVKEKETEKSDKTEIETIVEIHRERNDTELSSMEAEAVGKTSHEEVIRNNFDENMTTEYNDIAEDMLTDENLEREMMNEADDVEKRIEEFSHKEQSEDRNTEKWKVHVENNGKMVISKSKDSNDKMHRNDERNLKDDRERKRRKVNSKNTSS
ncbi:uncharacterized protein DDB_G0283697-like [Macrobrachium rosenbergii]|uniref:uncharacterized protein DDB_G0283697-like n=1 Tax=Macrobrachium rosenbergii TaxID=79674 RepID=UPI0034D65184